MKRSFYLWLVTALLFLSVFLEIFALIGVLVFGSQTYYGTHALLNDLAVASLVFDIFITCFYLYQIFYSKNLILWTDIYFCWAILRIAFAIIADLISEKGTQLPNAVEMVAIAVIWFLLRKHIKRLISKIPLSTQ